MIPEQATAEWVISRLEEAGATLMALPPTGYTTHLKTSRLDWVQDAVEAYGLDSRFRPPVPPPERVTRMDEAMAWLALIPEDKFVLRRVVGARAMISPLSGKHLFSWRQLGVSLHADHKAVQRWHANGIDMIVSALNKRAKNAG